MAANAAAKAQPTTTDPNPLLRGEALYRSLLERILAGRYPPGSRLPSEVLLADEFAVSRPVVRQALARLQDEQIIQTRRGAGSFVARSDEPEPSPFTPIACLADIDRCFEFRASLEGAAARLAARNAGPAARAAIGRAHDHLDAVLLTGALGKEADLAFHLAIAEASGNRYFAELLQALQPHLEICMRMVPRLMRARSPARIEVVRAEHRRILDAIASGQEEAAFAAMAGHIAAARHRIFEGDAPRRQESDTP